MTQPTAEQINLARKCAAKTYTDPSTQEDIIKGEWDRDYHVRAALLAIQATEARMAAAVEAERERCARIASLMQSHPDAAEFEHWRDGFECATVAIAAAIRSDADGQG